MKSSFLPLVCAGLGLLAPAARIVAQAAEPPYQVAVGLFDPSRPNDLGLKPAPGAWTVTIFQPTQGVAQYNNGVGLIAFKGQLYAQWQSSATDEDAPDTQVVCSRSRDGEHWTRPLTLASAGTGLVGGWRNVGGLHQRMA